MCSSCWTDLNFANNFSVSGTNFINSPQNRTLPHLCISLHITSSIFCTQCRRWGLPQVPRTPGGWPKLQNFGICCGLRISDWSNFFGQKAVLLRGLEVTWPLLSNRGFPRPFTYVSSSTTRPLRSVTQKQLLCWCN